MKLDNMEWLFFDVGSTLVSEEKPFLHRLHEIADAVNEPFDAIQNFGERNKIRVCRLCYHERGDTTSGWRYL